MVHENLQVLPRLQLWNRERRREAGGREYPSVFDVPDGEFERDVASDRGTSVGENELDLPASVHKHVSGKSFLEFFVTAFFLHARDPALEPELPHRESSAHEQRTD